MPVDKSPRLVLFRGYWAVYHDGARTSTGSTDRGEAERFLANYTAALKAPAAGLTVASLLSAYLATRTGKPGHERLRWAHLQLGRVLGEKPADLLDKAELDRYAAARQAAGVSLSTIRTELQALRAALRWHLGDRAPRVAVMPKPQARQRWLTRDEADKILAACTHRHVRLFILLALHTAARARTILDLTWDRVDLERRRIDYRVPGLAETRKRRVPVPINAVLFEALAVAKDRATCTHVIEFGGAPVASVRHGVSTAAEKAGVADVTPHVFRHTAATWMAQAGVPMWSIAGMLGHSNTAMVDEVYAHHAPDHLRDAAIALAG